MEIPIDLINQVQISLRRHANLPSYDPNDTSLDDLTSAEEAVAALDPSPPYLRCRHCKGRLLRGLQSSICVFCGSDALNDVVPDPIHFRNTVGFRWLLDSLNLDGSEMAKVFVDAKNKSRRRNATEDELPLSDLLDLEINWSSELLDDYESRRSNEKPIQSKASINLSGVNIESFFSNKEKGDDGSNASVELSMPFNQTNLKLFEGAQINEIEKSKEINLFDNARPSKTAVVLSGYLDSGWGADFPSAPPARSNVESTSFDPFVGSVVLSAQMDEVFGSAKDTSNDRRDGAATESPSMAGDWFSDHSNSALSGAPRVIQNVDWAEDSAKENDNDVEEGDDSFDDWNEFAGSTTAQDPSKQTTLPYDTEFIGSFSQRDLFSGEFISPDVLKKSNTLLVEASDLDRTGYVSTNSEGSSDKDKKDVESSPSKAEDVQMILSQMHDLSFMLDTDLSIPSKPEGLNSLSPH